jgi:hypothetical protein
MLDSWSEHSAPLEQIKNIKRASAIEINRSALAKHLACRKKLHWRGLI